MTSLTGATTLWQRRDSAGAQCPLPVLMVTLGQLALLFSSVALIQLPHPLLLLCEKIDSLALVWFLSGSFILCTVKHFFFLINVYWRRVALQCCVLFYSSASRSAILKLISPLLKISFSFRLPQSIE